jgi:hypothetical protein
MTTETPGVYKDGGFDRNPLFFTRGNPLQHRTYTVGSTVTADVAAEVSAGLRYPGVACWTAHGYTYAKDKGGLRDPNLTRILALSFDTDTDVVLSAHMDCPQDVTSTHLSSADVLAAVGGDSIQYVFSSATAAGDVDPGVIRLDDATENASTTLRLNLEDRNLFDPTDDDNDDLVGADVSALVDAIASGDRLFLAGSLFGNSSPDQWIAFDVTSAATPSGFTGQVDVGVTVVASSETSPFTDGDKLTLWLPDT